MNRTQKAESVQSLNEAFKSHELVVFAHYSGLTVNQISDLRRKMMAVGAKFKVAKNRLAKIAAKGTDYEQASALLKGPTAIAFSKDPVAAAKVAAEYAKTNDNLKIIGGGMGSKLLDKKDVEALSKLPSLDELRAKLIGMLVTPATRIATITQAPASQLARVIKAYSEKSA